MNGAGEPDLAALADRVLEMVGSGAEAKVTVRRVEDGLTRFANSFIHQNVVDQHVSISLDLVSGGRPASAATTEVDDRGIRRLVDTAAAAAAVRPPDPGWAGLCPPSRPTVAPDAHFDASTAAAGPDRRAEVVAEFVEAGEGLEAAGYCQTVVTESVFANSAGHRIRGRTTMAVIDGIQRAGGSDGCGGRASYRLADLDGRAAGRRAAETARAGLHPVELPAGHYEVVLEPRCVAYLLDFFAIYGFNARAVMEGRSFARIGEQQLDGSLSIWDDAGDPRHVGPAFDADGTPKRRTPLVDAGVVVGLTHDRRTAAASGDGVASTGHAVPGGESVGAVAANLFLGPAPATGAGGRTAPEPSASPTEGVEPAELTAGVERGLLVSDLWYTRVLDPKTLVVTGLTRNGVFLLEGGQIGPAVSNLRFTQSPVAALAPGHVLGVAPGGALAPGGLHLGWNHAPALRLGRWSFTGNASG